MMQSTYESKHSVLRIELKKFRVQFFILMLLRNIITHLFNTLPIFLPKDCMIIVDKSYQWMKTAELAINNTDELLKMSEVAADILSNQLARLENLAAENQNYRQKLEDAFKNVGELMLECVKFDARHPFKPQLRQIYIGWEDVSGSDDAETAQQKATRLFGIVRHAWNMLQVEIQKIQSRDLKTRLDQFKKSFNEQDFNTFISKVIKAISARNRLGTGGNWLLVNKTPEVVLLILEKLFGLGVVKAELPKMTEVLQTYLDYLIEKTNQELKNRFAKQYDKYLQICLEEVYHKNWLTVLRQRSKDLLTFKSAGSCFDLKDVSHVLVVKNLIFTLKNQHYIEFFADANKKRRTEDAIMLFNQHSVKNLSAFKKPMEKVIAEIAMHEDGLKKYGWGTEFATAAIRMWTGSFYSIIGRKWMVWSNEKSKFNLPENHLTSWGNMLGATFFGMEYFVRRKFGVTMGIVNQISPHRQISTYQLVKTAGYVGVNRETVLQNLENIRWLMGLGVIVLSTCILIDMSAGTVCFVVGSHVVGSLCRKLANYSMKNKISKDDVFKAMAINAGSYMGGAVLWKYSYPTIHRFFSPATVDEMLNSKKECMNDKKRCELAMKKILELQPNATIEEVKKQWRRLALKYHPDTTKEDDAEGLYEKYNNAQTRLTEVFK